MLREMKPLIETAGTNALEQPFGIPLEAENLGEMNSLLETNNWNLNVFQMSSLCSFKPLTCLGYHVFKVNGLALNPTSLQSWIPDVRARA